MLETLRACADLLNIDLIGITKAYKLDIFEQLLRTRKEQGYSTNFESDNVDQRINPNLILSDVKSIIVIGMSYNYTEDLTESEYEISNHARGYDYHLLLKDKLEELASALKAKYDFNYSIQVDTGTLLERAYGNLAGLGYFGKNSCLINDEYGSFINLGLLLTTIPYGEDSVLRESECGECTICIDSCPGEAIIGDYTISSKMCHSFLTQSKAVSDELKNIRYVYGCDICQLVCPKNSDTKRVEYNYDTPLMFGFDKEELSNISNKEFKRRYSEYSFSWVGRNIILRNMETIDKK